MPLKISVSLNEASMYSKSWEVVETNSSQDLTDIVRTKAYSNAIFEKGKNRSIKTVIGFHKYLILDIDNDKTDFTIKMCQDLFIKNGIESLIVPSRSHKKAKNGVIKDRYRVFCYMDQAFPIELSKEDYKFVMNEIVKDLQMKEYVDNKALFDKSRLFYPTKDLASNMVCKSKGQTIPLDIYLEKLKIHKNKLLLIEKIGIQRKSYNTKHKIIPSKKKKKLPKSKKKAVYVSSEEHFIYEGIYKYSISELTRSINFSYVIDLYETITSREENTDGFKIRTADKNTYQKFTGSGVLLDLKNDIPFNLYTYIKNFHNCATSIDVLSKMRELTIVDHYQSINEKWQDAIKKSLDISTNRREFEENLRTMLKFDKVSVQKENEEVIMISGKKFHIADFELQEYQCKFDIVKKFQENRK